MLAAQATVLHGVVDYVSQVDAQHFGGLVLVVGRFDVPGNHKLLSRH